MDYDTYRTSYFVEPEPTPRFDAAIGGATLYFEDYGAAVAYYTEVLGDPAYVEGEGTRGWRLGTSWLTLLAGGDGAPSNTEVMVRAASASEAEAIQQAFIAAGGSGPSPSDQLMFTPVRMCPVTDPFGTEIVIYAPR